MIGITANVAEDGRTIARLRTRSDGVHALVAGGEETLYGDVFEALEHLGDVISEVEARALVDAEMDAEEDGAGQQVVAEPESEEDEEK